MSENESDQASNRETQQEAARATRKSADSFDGNGGWEQDALRTIALASIKEQRAARRWRIFFRFAWLAVLILFIIGIFRLTADDKAASSGRHTALVSLNGTIAADSDASADNIDTALEAAFADRDTAAVVLQINSPGGSPVQAGIIYRDIRRLRAAHPKTPLYAVIGDVGASGAYYVAAAADKIYVDQASIVGSIGVIMESFGFTGLMDKLGVERRVQTAGINKATGDPFSPETDIQKQHLQQMLDEIHQQFIDAVKNGRGSRLHETPDTFTGAFWTGAQAVKMGLADAFGDTDTVARDVVNAKDIVDFSVKESLTDRVARRIGTSIGISSVGALLNRSLQMQ